VELREVGRELVAAQCGPGFVVVLVVGHMDDDPWTLGEVCGHERSSCGSDDH